MHNKCINNHIPQIAHFSRAVSNKKIQGGKRGKEVYHLAHPLIRYIQILEEYTQKKKTKLPNTIKYKYNNVTSLNNPAASQTAGY